MSATDLPGMDLASLSYPPVASRTRFVLDAHSWRRAGLHLDDEAVAWAATLSPTDRILRAELLDEGVLAYFEFVLSTSMTIRPFYASCPVPDGDIDEWLTIRRYWRGPVPRQVLAAFRPEPP